MGFLLQITMSCLCALSSARGGLGAGCWLRAWWRQGAGLVLLGAGRWLCGVLAVRLVRCWVPGARAGAVSWLCAWWRQGAGAVPGASA